MAALQFGTDGVRGLANAELTPELALAVAAGAVRVLAAGVPAGTRPLAVVGRDTRASGPMLEAAVVAGLTSAGADVLLVGVIPTPGVAWWTARAGAALGVMLSASHNPMPDNGIKVFAAGGHKLDDDAEHAIETLATALLTDRDPDWVRPTGAGVGRVSHVASPVDGYVEHLLATLAGARLDGLTVVVDCAHGAASAVAPEALRRAGATVHVLGAAPDGLNINDGVGSTHLGLLQQAVLDLGADAGVAHDGDADRCLAVDATGAVVDGDQILAVLALALAERGALVDGTVVATVMSNLGLHLALREAGLTLLTTAVGDRYVLEGLRAGSFSLGGEQSGHVVLPEHATTGDGVLTALHLLARVAATGTSLRDLAAVVTRLPQVLVNCRVDRTAAGAPSVLVAVAEAEAELGGTGRVLLRPSGTEALVRVMVEAPTAELAAAVAERLADVVRLAGTVPVGG